jgi:hypothetical protein
MKTYEQHLCDMSQIIKWNDISGILYNMDAVIL